MKINRQLEHFLKEEDLWDEINPLILHRDFPQLNELLKEEDLLDEVLAILGISDIRSIDDLSDRPIQDENNEDDIHIRKVISMLPFLSHLDLMNGIQKILPKEQYHKHLTSFYPFLSSDHFQYIIDSYLEHPFPEGTIYSMLPFISEVQIKELFKHATTAGNFNMDVEAYLPFLPEEYISEYFNDLMSKL